VAALLFERPDAKSDRTSKGGKNTWPGIENKNEKDEN